MKQLVLSLVAVFAVSGGLFSSAASAADEDILKAKGCTNCHDAEKKKVGPAMKDIAANKAGKADELVAKVSGAKGHPKVNATEAEVKAAVEKMLATK